MTSTITADVEFRVRHYEEDGFSYTPISAEDFATFAEVSKAGRVLLHIEEAYEVVIANFMAWEETILGLAVRHMAGKHGLFKFDYFDPARRDLHRSLINFMTAAKALDDQARSAIADLTGKGEDFTAVKGFFSREYEGDLGYRVLCALRNHSQHHGLSVTGVSFGTKSLPDRAAQQRYGVVIRPYMHMSDLRSNDQFKANILAELEQVVEPKSDSEEESFDLQPYVRTYSKASPAFFRASATASPSAKLVGASKRETFTSAMKGPLQTVSATLFAQSVWRTVARSRSGGSAHIPGMPSTSCETGIRAFPASIEL